MNYGECLRKIQNYCIDKKIKNEVLVNEPLEDFFEESRLKKEKGSNKGQPFRYDYSESSKIKNNNLELSPQIREALCKVNMESIIEESMQRFYEDYIDKTMIGDMIDDFSTWIEESGVLGKKETSYIESFSNNPGLFLGKIVVKSLKQPNLKQNENESTIWARGNAYIKVIKGDLFSYAFGRRAEKKNKIVVIPFNTAFDTHLTTKAERQTNPLVSRNTIHGELLYRLSVKGISGEELSDRIRKDLISNGLVIGNEERLHLPIGTIATLDEGNATLYLLAISDFDNKNNAQSTAENIRLSLQCLIKHYDYKGQGNDLYIPLIGTGMSRAGLDYQDSFDLITKVLLENKKRINGGVNIVVQPKVIDKLTILKENEYAI